MSDVLDDLRDFVDWQDQYNEITTKRIQVLEEMNEEMNEEECEFVMGYDKGYSDAMQDVEEAAPKKKKK